MMGSKSAACSRRSRFLPTWVEGSFTRATRAVEASAELKKRGYDRETVRKAVERTRNHVGTQELTASQWVEIALRYCDG